MTTTEDRMMQIFLPDTYKKTRELSSVKTRFVYYTTAETAACILRDRQIWMRNTAIMNDYMEVEYGFECVNAAYKGDPGKRFNAELDACFPGLSVEARDHFNDLLPTIRTDTYITAVSEHMPSEDEHGRLSMWRAYGGKTGVALVLNGDVFFSESNVLNVFSIPVTYLRDFTSNFENVAENMKREAEFIKSSDRGLLKHMVFIMLWFSVLCTKHPGFHEEKEWRVIASPKLYPSTYATPAVEVIHGMPQTVLKLGLQNHPEQGLVGLELPQLLERIIIGPCESPQVLYTAFHRLLVEANVPDSERKIIMSDIPLRHS